MSVKRNQLPDITKRQIIESLRSNQMTLKDVEAKYGVDKYQIQRWEAKFMAQDMSQGKSVQSPVITLQPLGMPKVKHENGNGNGHSSTHKSVSGDPRDRLIMQLQVKVANQLIEIDRLRAELNGHKRYSDQELYLDNRRESE